MINAQDFIEHYDRNEELKHHLGLSRLGGLSEETKKHLIRHADFRYKIIEYTPKHGEGLELAFMSVVVLYTFVVGVVSSLVTLWII